MTWSEKDLSKHVLKDKKKPSNDLRGWVKFQKFLQSAFIDDVHYFLVLQNLHQKSVEEEAQQPAVGRLLVLPLQLVEGEHPVGVEGRRN